MYQFDLNSPAFQSFLFLEDMNQNTLAEHSSPTIGGNSRIAYRAVQSGVYRIVVTSLGGFRIGPFTLTARDDIRPPDMPLWFADLDTDRDEQVSLNEWLTAGRAFAAFSEHDHNGDGFITLGEVKTQSSVRPDLKFDKGKLTHADQLVTASDPYRGKTAYQVRTMQLEAGKKYDFRLISPAFQSFIFLEDASSHPLLESSSQGIGAESHLHFRPTQTATYRVVVTSLGGFRTGSFTLTANDGTIPKGPLPVWFYNLDTDRDGQVGLDEWRTDGRTLQGFRAFDLNDDGYITPQELQRSLIN